MLVLLKLFILVLPCVIADQKTLEITAIDTLFGDIYFNMYRLVIEARILEDNLQFEYAPEPYNRMTMDDYVRSPCKSTDFNLTFRSIALNVNDVIFLMHLSVAYSKHACQAKLRSCQFWG